MIASDDSARHEEAWRSLPWLANGRLAQAEREKIEPHVRGCAACREELAFQRLLCNVLTEPDRVTYAPGPSFRKLMDRIDGAAPPARKTPEREKAPVTPLHRPADKPISLSTWRPPGLAWAASFILAIGLGGIVTTMYRSSEPLYKTHTDAARTTENVLHISFDRSVTVGEAEAALRSSGARVVEGPDSSGIFGVTPDSLAHGTATPERVSEEMRGLSARLHADPRVRWVEPQVSTSREP
ncbi:MAG TPA: zf-HC2 domain-containing protein [Steroidobacteraceae bacterium]